MTGVLLFSASQPGTGLRADLFSGTPTTVCIQANGQESIEGDLGRENVTPGTTVHGLVHLTDCGVFPRDQMDLDIGFDPHVMDIQPFASPDLGHLLFVANFSYGPDDLLRTEPTRIGDRNALLEIDAHPFRGNRDGRLSLRELAAGIDDLPAPGPASAPTDLVLDFVFADISGNELMGDRASLDLRFFLSDRTNGDLD